MLFLSKTPWLVEDFGKRIKTIYPGTREISIALRGFFQENRKSVLLFDFSENLFIGIDVGVHIAAKETGLGKLLSLGIGDDDRGIAPDLVLGLKFPVLATTPG